MSCKGCKNYDKSESWCNANCCYIVEDYSECCDNYEVEENDR